MQALGQMLIGIAETAFETDLLLSLQRKADNWSKHCCIFHHYGALTVAGFTTGALCCPETSLSKLKSVGATPVIKRAPGWNVKSRIAH
jgi:hypothetical protein